MEKNPSTEPCRAQTKPDKVLFNLFESNENGYSFIRLTSTYLVVISSVHFYSAEKKD